ncbi:MAG: hypothetical protein NTU61_03140 [Candidatus Altiarchaeota archaeon]|nr:hypothetical protein [Candidatus Altiarchaeota archaeon]
MDLKKEIMKDDGKAELLTGVSLGAFGAAGAIGGAICPICVIGTPLFLGLGVYKKIKYGKAKK